MKIMTSIVANNLHDSGVSAQSAEAMGYDGVLTMENTHDPFLPLAVAAVQTKRLELGTSIALAFPRSPMVVANTAHDLQTSSGGRFVLGLGSQVKGHNERRFSVPWSAPVPRLREYIEALRCIWRCWETGVPLNYVGEHYQFTLMTPNFTPQTSGQPMVPITISAVGPAMLRLSGRVCDGVRLHSFCTQRYIENVVMPQLNEGFEQGGRTRENFEIAGGGFIATGPDQQTVDEMFEFVRYRVAFYGSTRSYHPVLEQHGLEDLGMKLHHMSKNNQWTEMPAQVPDDVVRLFAAVGTHEELAKAIVQHFGGLSDSLSETLLPNSKPSLPSDLLQDLQKISSPFTGYVSDW